MASLPLEETCFSCFMYNGWCELLFVQSLLKSLGSYMKDSWQTETECFKYLLHLLLVKLGWGGNGTLLELLGSPCPFWSTDTSLRNLSGRGSFGPAPGYKGNWLKASSNYVISWTLSWLGTAQTALFGWLVFLPLHSKRASLNLHNKTVICA